MKKLLLALVAVSSMQAIPFLVVDEHKGVHPVHSYNVDKVLRDIPVDKLSDAGKYLAIMTFKDNRGEYHIKAHVRGLGGGPVLGTVAWGATWAAGIGTIAAMAAYEGPVAVLHAPEILEMTTTTAQAAFIAGSLAPTA